MLPVVACRGARRHTPAPAPAPVPVPPSWRLAGCCPVGGPVRGGMHFYRGSGAGAARYFDEGHRGAEAYYTEAARVAVEIDTWVAGERAATTVLAEPGDLVRWVEGIDPATGEPKGVIRLGGADRQPLRFVEVVVNNPKSLSIVASQNPAVAAAYDRTLARQADEIARYLSAVAVTRIGARGAQREVGGLAVETARVTHLTSREGDPHRHVHLMLNTRVKTPDRTWHALHSAAIRQHIRAVHERGARVLLCDGELRSVLADQGYTLGADGEIDQARAAVALLSKRSAATAANRERIEAQWREAHPGREPSQRVRNGWDSQAWAEGRPTKPAERESVEQLAERVRVELEAAGFDFTPGAHKRIGWDPTGPGFVSVGQVERDQVAAEAVAVLSANKSAWSVAELAAEVEAAVSRSGVVGDPQAVAELVEDVAARAAEGCLSVLDPEVRRPTAMSRHLTSEAVIDADMRLNVGLAGLAGGRGERDLSGEVLAGAEGLDAGQGEAVAAVCGTRRLEVVIGPAGTGKTAMLSVAKAHLDAQGRELVVVAPTRKAAQVAGAEVGVDGASLSKLLYDHGWRWDELGRWSRLAPGEDDPATGRVYQGPDTGSALSAASVVVVDEAGLMTVDQANALIDVVAASGASLRLVGDPRQLGAVGRGGVMETASRWVEGGPVTLDEVHRFLSVTVDGEGMPVTETDVAYGELTLRLREGVEPDQVADQLAARGAVVLHDSDAAAVEAIANQVAAQGARGEALAVTVATNDDARKVNQAVRELRVQSGQVDDTTTAVGMDGTRIGAGDRIITRRNDTTRDVANRETWSVEKVTDDGSLLAHNGDRHVRLEAGYVADAVQLGYATTDYGNQGVTADASVTWLTDATSAGGLYVGATRGRYENTLHVVAADHDDARRRLVAAMGRDRGDRGLDVARQVAEAAALQADAQLLGAELLGAGPAAEALAVLRGIDLSTWRSEAELTAAEERLEARSAARIAAVGPDDPVLAEDVLAHQNQADHDEAALLVMKSAQARSEAARIEALRPEQVTNAAQDFFAARTDAQVEAAGPGLFSRHEEQVEAARARLAEISRRWGSSELPSALSPDVEVVQLALDAAERFVDEAVTKQLHIASDAEHQAGALEHRVVEREQERRRAQEANIARREKRQAIVADTEARRAELVAMKTWRAQVVGAIGPKLTAIADATRPGTWRAEAELQRDEAAIEEHFTKQMKRLGDTPVLTEETWARHNATDRDEAARAEAQAATARAEIGRLKASRSELLDSLGQAYLAARDDAVVIDGGPGLFGRRADQVEKAHLRRQQLAQQMRVADPSASGRLPDAHWSDAQVSALVDATVARIVDLRVEGQRTELHRAEAAKAEAQRRIVERDQAQRRLREGNEERVGQRQELLSRRDAGRARVAAARALREAATKLLTPKQVLDADRARDEVRLRGWERRLLRPRGAKRISEDEYLGWTLERGGPGLER